MRMSRVQLLSPAPLQNGKPNAQMAELVDALGSGPSGSNPLEVRVLFWAPVFKDNPFFKKGFIVSALYEPPHISEGGLTGSGSFV